MPSTMTTRKKTTAPGWAAWTARARGGASFAFFCWLRVPFLCEFWSKAFFATSLISFFVALALLFFLTRREEKKLAECPSPVAAPP